MKKTTILFPLLLLALPVLTTAQTEPAPEAVVRRLYDLVTFPKGAAPDWDELRSLFLKEAVVALRSSHTKISVFSVDAFVQDFVSFIERAKVMETGFEEKIVDLKMVELGDIAQCFVIYEARIPGSDRAPQQGVDSFQLIRQNGVWRIVSIINEIPGTGREIPAAMRN